MKLALKILGIILVVFITFAFYKKYQSSKKKELIGSILSDRLQKEETELKKNKVDCERSVLFDGNNFCFPKIKEWKECRTDENLKAHVNTLEWNNKILSCYIPTEFYENSKAEKKVSYPIVILSIQDMLIGRESDESTLTMVFTGMKNAYKIQDFKTVEEQLKKKGKTFTKPVLFDSYEISIKAKTCVVVRSSNRDGEIVNEISFNSIIDLKKRIMTLSFHQGIGNDFQYSKMKLENEQIVKKIIEAN